MSTCARFGVPFALAAGIALAPAAYAQTLTPLPKAGWHVQFVDSQETSAGAAFMAERAIDDDPTTFWHTDWNVAAAPPHEIQIDLGASATLAGFVYAPRADGPYGRIAGYEFYVSSDGSHWGAPVASGTFENSSAEQTVTFPARAARYARLRALSEVSGLPYTALAEIGLLRPGDGSAEPPPSGGGQPGWTLVYVDSQDESASGAFHGKSAFDKNPATFWHTQWADGQPSPPHEIRIDLNATRTLSGLRYLPRQDAPYGRIAAYQIYLSLDGSQWGAPVASGTFPNTADEQFVPFTATTARFIRLRALSEVSGLPYSAVAEIDVTDDGSNPPPPPDPPPPSQETLPRNGWLVRYVDSEEVGGFGTFDARKAFDGNTGTFWHTEWSASQPVPPHELQIDLRSSYAVSGFTYVPRQDAPYGRIARYEFFVSLDGVNWGAPVSSGTFPNSPDTQSVTFPAKVGRYVRLRALSEVSGLPYAAAAELHVLGDGSSGQGGEAPGVSLVEVSSGPYIAPASIALLATVWGGTVAIDRVDFYAGATLIESDRSIPYEAIVGSVGAGSHSIVAVARDVNGNASVSNTLGVLVTTHSLPNRAVFVPSTDHDTLVVNYVLEIFPADADPWASNAIATLDLGKPPVVNGECVVDIGSLIAPLWPGVYIGTVTAYGSGGASRSAPSPPFVR